MESPVQTTLEGKLESTTMMLWARARFD